MNSMKKLFAILPTFIALLGCAKTQNVSYERLLYIESELLKFPNSSCRRITCWQNKKGKWYCSTGNLYSVAVGVSTHEVYSEQMKFGVPIETMKEMIQEILGSRKRDQIELIYFFTDMGLKDWASWFEADGETTKIHGMSIIKIPYELSEYLYTELGV